MFKEELLMHLLKNISHNLFIIEKLLIIMKLLNSTDNKLEERINLLLPEMHNIEIHQEYRMFKDQLLNIIILKLFNLLSRRKVLWLIFRDRLINM